MDVLCCSDIRRLPRAGREAIVGFFNECERQLMWPWQLLCAIVMVTPKPAKGDRALGLLPAVVPSFSKGLLLTKDFYALN